MQSNLEKLGIGESTASLILWIGLSLVLLIVVVAVAAWLVRALRPSLNLGGGGRGGRPQRLAVTDAFTLDRDGRKLVIVRRDNVEHLLLIGGPNDVLVEGNIVRGERAARGRPGSDELTALADGLSAPEASTRPEMPMTPPSFQPPAPQPAPVPPAPLPPPPMPPQRMAPPPAPPAPPPARPAPMAPPLPAASAAQMDDDFERSLVAGQPLPGRSVAPPQRPMAPPVAPPPPAPQPAAPPPAAPAPAAQPERPARQEPVSEMARRLNEVLQKPLSGQLRPPFNKPIPPVPSTPSVMPSAPPPAAAPAEKPPAPVMAMPANEPRKAAPVNSLDELDLLAAMIDPPRNQGAKDRGAKDQESKGQEARMPAPGASAPPAAPPVAAKPAETDMDMLEEEMARLLGRPNPPKAP
ncbi:MAG: hypothetical protein O9333_12540 [Beijerinckiaceae bacterium]|jgi:flagellar protein FliO/FliZ|nr:hypothetical protein [Beijerinckiaceae bacterium]